MFQSLWSRAGSFDLLKLIQAHAIVCFNPFGTGRGLSTNQIFLKRNKEYVSIPLEQGGVFRLRGWFGALMDKAWEDRFPTFPLMRKVRYGFD